MPLLRATFCGLTLILAACASPPPRAEGPRQPALQTLPPLPVPPGSVTMLALA
ncbi:MAG: hypothetical protein K2X11_09045 [Acetobacteraceae bacterium]|nr:hypothetical protein [Acetobacteraceae bacterium]